MIPVVHYLTRIAPDYDTEIVVEYPDKPDHPVKSIKFFNHLDPDNPSHIDWKEEIQNMVQQPSTTGHITLYIQSHKHDVECISFPQKPSNPHFRVLHMNVTGLPSPEMWKWYEELVPKQTDAPLCGDYLGDPVFIDNVEPIKFPTEAVDGPLVKCMLKLPPDFKLPTHIEPIKVGSVDTGNPVVGYAPESPAVVGKALEGKCDRRANAVPYENVGTIEESNFQEVPLTEAPPKSYNEAFAASGVKDIERCSANLKLQQAFQVTESTKPTVTTFSTGAVRSTDANTSRFDLISPIGLLRVARTCKEGYDKYGAHNWTKGMPIGDILNHCINHIYSYLLGDRSEDHLSHATWNLLAAMYMEVMRPDLSHELDKVLPAGEIERIKQWIEDNYPLPQVKNVKQ